MEHWEDHGFAPTGPLENDHTHVSVYKDDNDAAWKRRARELKPPHYPPLDRNAENWEIRHEEQREKMRKDKKYQFVLLVAGKAGLKLNQMWRTPSEDPGRGSANEGNTQLGGMGPIAEQYDLQHRWTSSPLISGKLYLSTKVFANLLEAEQIVINKVGRHVSLDYLMTNNGVRTFFAHFVANLIKLDSNTLGDKYQPIINYQRLRREQTLLLHRIARVLGHAKHVPGLPTRRHYPAPTSTVYRFNTSTGSY